MLRNIKIGYLIVIWKWSVFFYMVSFITKGSLQHTGSSTRIVASNSFVLSQISINILVRPCLNVKQQLVVRFHINSVLWIRLATCSSYALHILCTPEPTTGIMYLHSLHKNPISFFFARHRMDMCEKLLPFLRK
jgi:hypothetical protein